MKGLTEYIKSLNGILFSMLSILVFTINGFSQLDTLKQPSYPSLYAFVSIETGVANFDKRSRKYSMVFETEVGIPLRLWIVYPIVGGYATSLAATYLYGGIMIPVRLSRLLSVKVTGGAGYYQPGYDADLYLALEFCLNGEIAFNLKNNYRLAIKFGHLSNAGLGSRNPSQNRLTLGLKIPYK